MMLMLLLLRRSNTRPHITTRLTLALQNGIQEEELGPVPLVLARDGPRVQAGLGQGSAADTGQEVLFQGERRPSVIRRGRSLHVVTLISREELCRRLKLK